MTADVARETAELKTHISENLCHFHMWPDAECQEAKWFQIRSMVKFVNNRKGFHSVDHLPDFMLHEFAKAVLS